MLRFMNSGFQMLMYKTIPIGAPSALGFLSLQYLDP